MLENSTMLLTPMTSTVTLQFDIYLPDGKIRNEKCDDLRYDGDGRLCQRLRLPRVHSTSFGSCLHYVWVPDEDRAVFRTGGFYDLLHNDCQ